MTDAVAILANGVVYGSIYGLVAIGMTLIYGTLRILDMSQGSMVMVGGYIGWWALATHGVNPVIALALAFVFTGTGTIKGCFLVYCTGALSTVDNTAGTLYSVGLFTGGDQPVVSLVADGPPGTVPDLRCMSARDAIHRLVKVGLNAHVAGDGFVLSKDPPPGAPLEPGAVCRLQLTRSIRYLDRAGRP